MSSLTISAGSISPGKVKPEINLPSGARSITLPDNDKIKILAITVANNPNENVTPLQLLYDDFKDNKPVQLRIKEYVTPDLQPMKYNMQRLVDNNVDQSMMTNPRTIANLKNLGMDTVIVKTSPSTSDYADINSGNNVTVTYYATGKSIKGTEYRNAKFDISNILNSGSGKLKDTVQFDNGEGRIVIDLQKSISIDKISFYIDQFRNRGSQIFSIWASATSSDIIGDPKSKGWQYVGLYGMSERGSGGGGGGARGGGGVIYSGTSYRFNGNLSCRFLMILTDGNWHGTEYFNQLDIFEKK